MTSRSRRAARAIRRPSDHARCLPLLGVDGIPTARAAERDEASRAGVCRAVARQVDMRPYRRQCMRCVGS